MSAGKAVTAGIVTAVLAFAGLVYQAETVAISPTEQGPLRPRLPGRADGARGRS